MDNIQKIESKTKYLDKGLEIIAVSFLILSVLLAIFSVVMRYFWGISFGLVEELCRSFIIYGVFTYVGPLIKTNEHIKMDLISSILRGRVKHLNDLIISILLFFVFALLFWNGVQWVKSLFDMKLLTGSGLMPMYLPTFAIPIGMFFGCIYAAYQIIIDLYRIRLSKISSSINENHNNTHIDKDNSKTL